MTKSVFHVSGGPASLPSFVHDMSQSIGAWVNDETYRYAATGESAHPFVAPTGGKEPLLAQLDEFDMGSDHEVYQDASWRIPAIYLHDWPDRFIHTTQDTPDKIDPTKLLRAGFITKLKAQLKSAGYMSMRQPDGSTQVLVTLAGSGPAPELLIHDGDVYRTVKLDWHGGLRYPRLQKVGTGPGTLDALLAPR